MTCEANLQYLLFLCVLIAGGCSKEKLPAYEKLTKSELKKKIETKSSDWTKPNRLKNQDGIFFGRIEFQIKTSLDSEIGFLKHQEPCWEEIFVYSDDHACNLIDIEQLRKIENVSALWFPYISRSAFIEMSQIDSLKELTITNMKQVDSLLHSLDSKFSLTFLQISHANGVKRNSIYLVKCFQNLETLVLSGTDIADADLIAISKLPNLRVLYLTDTNISHAGLEHLLASNSLEIVYVSIDEIPTVISQRAKFRIKN